MKKYSAMPFIKTSLSLLLILTFLNISGCAGTGSNVPPEKRVDLIQAENNQGLFKSPPFSLEYSYTLTGSSMISGSSNMILAGRAFYGGGADSLDIRILFLDSAGTVLQKKMIYSSGFRSDDARGSKHVFQKTLNVPPGSASISFTYSAIDRSSHR
ncbi:MAG: hypothetical protein JRJ68_08745 [Deltaproteobacteria bacterium]|nr:hypothetical protein [Deltaproteobacteria bacterium]